MPMLMSLSNSPDPVGDNTAWRRVSPISIGYFLIANIQHSLNLWPVLAGALTNQHARTWLMNYGVLVIALVLLAFAFLSYWFFRYQFDAEKIQIRSGIFQKKRLTLYFDRVQEANLEQAIYFRPFSLWTLRLESAGSSKEEIALPGINENLAQLIKQQVLSNKTVTTEWEPERDIAAPDFEVRLDLLDLVRYGLMHNTLVYFVAIIAPLLGQNEALLRHLANFVESLQLTRWLLDYISAHSSLVGVIAVGMLITFFLCAIYLISILLAGVKYWKYRLKVQGGRLQYEAGLFNRVACGFRQHKLQTVIVKQGLIARILKRYSLELRQANEVMQPGGKLQGFMIPVLDRMQLDEVLKLLQLDSPHWQRTLPVQIFWRSFFWGGFFTLSVLTLALATELFSPFWALLPLPLFILFSWKSWYSTYYSATTNDFAIKRGLLGRKVVYIPQIKVQKLELAQGPLGRLHCCASMSVWSGATRENIAYVELDKIRDCHQKILQKVATFRGRWM